ncbi:MAG: glycosyltransferase family 2 protein [Acetobacter sp.]|nr:glycosyltransferase family 2 protein [Acetobacter sp.]
MKKIWILIFITLMLSLGVYKYIQQKITISVVIPVYNAEKYLARCLDSIFIQDGDFEVIAVNDGSTDKSLDILKQYSEKHPNLIVINQKNQGISGARNTGMKAAKNKYITFIDNDDWFEPNAFENIERIIKVHHPDIVLTNYYDVYDREWVKNTQGEKVAKNSPEEKKYIAHYIDRLALLSPFYGKDAHSDLFYMGFAHGQFYKKNFLDTFNIKFIDTLGEDVLFNFQAYFNNPKIYATTLPVYDFHNRADSVSKSEKLMTGIPKTLELWKRQKEFIESSHINQMYMLDALLFSWVMSIANLRRHNQPIEECAKKAVQALNDFASQYNKEELKLCRHFKQLYQLLYDTVNQPL